MRVYTCLQGGRATESKSAAAADNGELNCMGTGMDVACTDDVNGAPKVKQMSPENLQAPEGVPSLNCCTDDPMPTSSISELLH